MKFDMEQKMKDFIMENRGTAVLFLLTLAVTVVSGAASSAVIGWCFGTLSLVGVDYAASLVGMRLGDTDRPGIVGIALGVLISSII